MRVSVVFFIKNCWPKSFNNEIVSQDSCFWIHLYNYFQGALNFFNAFCWSNGGQKVNGMLNFGWIQYNKVPKCYRGKFVFFKKNCKSSEYKQLERCSEPSVTDSVEALNTLTQDRLNLSESCTIANSSRKMQNVLSAHVETGLTFSSTNLNQYFGRNTGDEIGIELLKGWPGKAHILRTCSHTLLLNTHISNCVQNYWLHGGSFSAFFVSTARFVDLIVNGQNTNYWRFLAYISDACSKKIFYSVHIDFRKTNGGKWPLRL